MNKIYGINDKALNDTSIPIHDLIHGYLKVLMNETETELVPLLENSERIGSDEEYEDTIQRLELQGRMDALVEVFVTMTNVILDRQGIK